MWIIWIVVVIVVFLLCIFKWGAREKHISGTPFCEKVDLKNNICGFDFKNLTINEKTKKQNVLNYIVVCGCIPPFYVTEGEAEKAGYRTLKKNQRNLKKNEKHSLEFACPGKVIGGDVFQNKEGILPPGEYRKLDIDYDGHQRGGNRLVYSVNCLEHSSNWEERLKNCKVFSTYHYKKDWTKLFGI